MKKKINSIFTGILGFSAGIMFLISCGENSTPPLNSVTADPDPTLVVDQLVCSVPSMAGFVNGTYMATCLQSTLPDSTRDIYLKDIYVEGWVVSSTSYYGITFYK